MNIFCGSLNCYNILEVERDTPLKDIKKVRLMDANACHYLSPLIACTIGISTIILISDIVPCIVGI